MKTDHSAEYKLAASCEVAGILYALAHDAEREMLYGAGADRAVYSVDLQAETLVAEKRWTGHENYVSAIAVIGGRVVSAGYDGRLVWTNCATGEQVRAVAAHDGWIRDLAVFPDGNRLATVGDDMLVKVWDAESGALLASLDGHDRRTPQGYATALYALAVSPDGRHLASGDRIGVVRIWDAEAIALVSDFQAPTFYTYDARARVRSIGGIRGLRFSADSQRLAVAGIGKVTNVDGFVGPCRAELWDWRGRERLRTFSDNHKAVLNDIHFHPEQPWLVAAGGGDSGGVLAVWEAESEDKPLLQKLKPKGHIQRLAWDASGSRLFAAGYDGFQIWSHEGKPETVRPETE